MSRLHDLNELYATRVDEVARVEAQLGTDRDAWPEGHVERVSNIERGLTRLSDEIESLESRSERVEAVAQAWADSPSNLEAGVAGTGIEAPAPAPRTGNESRDRAARSYVDTAHRHYGLSDDVADFIERSLTEQGRRAADMAAWVEAAGNPAYLTGFSKRLGDPVSGHLTWTAAEAEAYRGADLYARTALSLTGASSMLPLVLDPTIALSGTGSTGGIRTVCRHEVTVSNAWNGVTSLGATSEWHSENLQAADGTPAISGKNIPVWLLDIDAVVSYEIEMDGLNFASELSKVLFDAAEVAVDAALATGSGSNAPTGIMTALTGTQDVVTAGAFASANVVALQNAVPPRFQPRAKFVAPLPVRNQIGSFETTAGSLRFPETSNGRLLNRDLVEDSNLSADMATSGSRFAVYGDWSQYLMVTRVGASIQVLPNFGANGRPTASKHYFLVLRVGADALVPNAFRVMKKS
jgi:predicted phage gp36 major capsid-like protein